MLCAVRSQREFKSNLRLGSREPPPPHLVKQVMTSEDLGHDEAHGLPKWHTEGGGHVGQPSTECREDRLFPGRQTLASAQRMRHGFHSAEREGMLQPR